MDQISKDYISGITWSGGDPMFESNIETVLDITQKIKNNIRIKRYGYTLATNLNN